MNEGNWLRVIHPDDRQESLRKWSHTLKAGEPLSLEHRIRRQDGTYRWHLARGVPYRDVHGNVLKWFGTSTDIDEQKAVEARSRFLSEATRTLIADRDFNSRLQKVAQLVVSQFADWCVIDLVKPDASFEAVAVAHCDPKKVALVSELRAKYSSKPDASRGVARVIRTGEPELIPEISEEVIRNAAQNDEHSKILLGLKLKSYICVPLVAHGRILGALTIVSSESDRRFTQEDLDLMEQIADRAALAIDNAKLYQDAQAAIHIRDEFLSIASHELKTPVTSLKLQLQLTQRRVKPEENLAPTPAKLAKVLDISTKQVDRLSALIEDLLDVSRIESGKLSYHFERVDLASLVKETVDRFSDQLQAARCPFEISASQPVKVICDRFRIEQVVANLITNAIKYGEGKPIRISVEPSIQGARIVVQDFGMGIEKSKQAKVFDRFERAISHNNISGLGLGLYITRQIVDAHGGTVSLMSELGQGSTFTVELPEKPPVQIKAGYA
jgi:signal transduction histidine kinase